MPTKDGIVAMNVYLPEATYRAFKIKCIEEGTTIKAVVLDFIMAYAGIEENDKSAGNSGEIEEKKES